LHPAVPFHQDPKKFKFGSRAFYDSLSRLHFMTGTVEGQVADFKPFTILFTGTSPAKDSPNAKDQFPWAKWLNDLIVGAELEPDYPINLIGSG
jgi:hypothetical protein